MRDIEIKKNLLIVIDITEKENAVLNDLGNVKEISGNGKLIIKNPSDKSRLWNITCDLKETVKTSFSAREIKIDTLDPLKDFSSDYTISNIKEPLLTIAEKFDTLSDFSDRENNTFLFAQDTKCQLKIHLTNQISGDIINIKLIKEIPSILKDIELVPPNNGTASMKEEEGSNKIFWELNSLGVGQSAELVVNCIGLANSVEMQPLGEIRATYLVNNRILTMIDPDIVAITDSMSGVTRDEGSKPGVWDCNVEFINESEFQIKLNDVRVEHNIITGKEIVVAQAPGKILNRDQAWDYDFIVESKEVPQLEPSFEFTTLFTAIKRVEGTIYKEPLYYPVLRAEVSKEIKPNEVGAYANTEMEIVNTIFNKGSAQIDKLLITDEITEDFEPPDLNLIKLFAKTGGELKEIFGNEYVKVFQITPDDKDLTKSHRIEIELFNMANDLSSDSTLEISYPIIARNPKPDKSYQIPITVQLNTKIEGKPYIIAPSETPEIKIKYIARKFKTLKSIKPGSAAGEFIVSIQLQNQGNVELENILIKDKIPVNFELISFSPMELKYELNKIENESELVVRIVELKADTVLKIEYQCSGIGEYPRYEPVVIVEGRKDNISKPEEKTEPIVSSTPESSIGSFAESLSFSIKSQIIDEIINLEKKITPGLKSVDVANMIEKLRDFIANIARVGPFIHEIGQIAREFKDLGEKTIVGESHDKITKKIKEWKVKFF